MQGANIAFGNTYKKPCDFFEETFQGRRLLFKNVAPCKVFHAAVQIVSNWQVVLFDLSVQGAF